MTATNRTDTAIANADALPRVINAPHLVRGPSFHVAGTIEKVAGDGDGSVFRFARIRSSDRIISVQLANDALAGATVGTIGLWRTAADGGAVVSAALFATALDIHLGQAFTEYAFNNVDIANVEKRVWELLALSADPMLDYDLGLTLTTAGSAAGTISMKATGTSGN